MDNPEMSTTLDTHPLCLLVIVPCDVCLMLPTSLGCPFLIVPLCLLVIVPCDVCLMLPTSLGCPFLIVPLCLLVIVPCDVCLMLPTSLGCPFLIASLCFSNKIKRNIIQVHFWSSTSAPNSFHGKRAFLQLQDWIVTIDQLNSQEWPLDS
jgi:hypothetical protein